MSNGSNFIELETISFICLFATCLTKDTSVTGQTSFVLYDW